MAQRKSRTRPTLADVLQKQKPWEFMEALLSLAFPPVTGTIREDAFPERIRMINLLYTFYLETSVSGMWKILIDEDAPINIPATQEFCRRIGADGAAEYIAAAVALFPKGRLPKSQARREAWEGRLERSDPAPLRELDQKYKGAVEKMVEHLRAYIRDHKAEFEGILAKPLPVLSAEEEQSLAEQQSQNLAEAAARAEKEEAEQQERIRRARQRRKDLGLPQGARAPQDDPRMLQFIEELTVMTPEQWHTVTDRWLANLRAIKRANSKLSSICFQVYQGRVSSRAETKRRKAAHDRARERARQLLDALERTSGPDQLEPRQTAGWAVSRVLLIVFAIDEIVVDKQDERAARVLFSPFEGFITRPW